MANFFIRRPIVAIVIAILTVIVGAIVHQDQVCAERASKGESFAFAAVECAPRRIINGRRNGSDIKPSRRLRHPGAYNRRRILV